MTLVATIAPPAPSPANWSWVRTGLAEVAGGDLYLSEPGAGMGAGSSFCSIPVPSNGLQVSYTTVMSGGTGGGGLTLALLDPSQTGPAVVGAARTGLGFIGLPGTAVAAITDPTNPPGSHNFAAVLSSTLGQTGAPSFTATATGIGDLRSGTHTWNVSVSSGTVTVTVDGTQVLSTAVSVPDMVLVGFTGANNTLDDLHAVRAVTIRAAGTVPGAAGGPATVKAHQFDVTAAGAVGDGATDDTVAIQTAINNAVAYAQAHSGYAEVLLPPRVYAIKGPLVQGGATKGNSQLTLPIIAPTANKVTLAFVGVKDASAHPHWQQTTPQVSGAVLRSLGVTGTLDNTYGEASVLGGPTGPQGYGTSATLFNNIMPVVDGVEIMVPNTIHGSDICGFDFWGCAEAVVISGSAMVDVPPPTITAGQPTGFAFGLRMPSNANNDNSRIESFSCQGFTYGMMLPEHTTASRVAAVYCYVGVGIIGSWESSTGASHGVTIMNASCEANTIHLNLTGSGAGGIGPTVWVGQLSTEGNGSHLFDQFSTGRGYVGLLGIINSINVPNPTGVKLEYLQQAPGHVTAPTVSATTVALQNPFWRDAAVTVSGSTVTAIAVDGTATGAVPGSNGATVFVPSGKTITLTYASGSPTWVWVLL